MCYTYDAQSRVTKRTVINLANNTLKDEVFAYDGAGNITYSMEDYEGSNFTYDTNNCLTCVCGMPVNYDADGNMLTAAIDCNSEYFSYDSTNRLISAGCNEYTYNVEDVRIRNLCNNTETKFVYNTNARLSQLLVKETAGVITKYVYGLGLIGEETGSDFKIHHYDYRGSTVALTNMLGDVTDTFTYDTYGKLISRTGVTDTLFMYNGRDGVVTEDNGLIYMRARYYSPELRRFINADIIHGEISNAITLNRYAYANGNPVSNVDPFGLSADNRGNTSSYGFDDVFKNDDGTYSLYDNKRHQLDNIFHEQILAIEPSGPSLNLKEGDIGLGSIQGDLMTGGWEWKYADLSLLDFGHAEAGAEFKNGKFKFGAMASAWSPSFSVKVFCIKIEIGAEVGAIGAGVKASSKGFSLNLAFLFGANLSISW